MGLWGAWREGDNPQPIGAPPSTLPCHRRWCPHGGVTGVPVPTESIPEDFYRHFGGPEVPPPSTLPFPHAEGPGLPEGCPPLGATKTKGPPKPSGGWEGGPQRGPRRPGPATPLYGQTSRHLATNSKTEVTV